VIELKNITKVYNEKKDNELKALKGVNLTLGENGLTFIIGKSGSGKSTLLNVLGGLDGYTSGEIIINGKSTKEFKEKDWDAYRNTFMGFVFQEYNLLDSYNIADNVKLSLELQGKKVTDQEVEKILNKVGLNDIQKRKPNELSGGQKQRVAIARTLIKNPDILLCDEPTGNLDSETSKQIFELLKEISKEKLVVIVSHDLDAANRYGDRIVKIADGEIVEDTKKVKSTEKIENLELKSAKLPLFYTFRMGVENLFKSKFRFILTFLLLIICFIFLGFTCALFSRNLEDEFINRFEENVGSEIKIFKYSKNISYSDISKKMYSKDANFSSLEEIIPSSIGMNDNDLNSIENKTGLDWMPEYNININGDVYYGVIDETKYAYYQGANVRFSYNDSIDKDKLIGNINNDDIVITSYIADYIIYNGINVKDNLVDNSEEHVYKPGSYQQIIDDGKYIKLENLGYFKVSGIYKVDTKKYDDLKNITYYNIDDNVDTRILDNQLEKDSSMHRVYMSKDKLNYYKNVKKNVTGAYVREKYKINNEALYFYTNDVRYGYLKDSVNIYDGVSNRQVNNLNKDEIIINTAFLNILTNDEYTSGLYDFLKNNLDTQETDYINKFLGSNDIVNSKLALNIKDNEIYFDFYDYKIVGVVVDKEEYPIIYFNTDNVDNLVGDSVTLEYVYRNFDNVEDLKKTLEYYPIDNSDMLVSANFFDDIASINNMIYFFKLVGKYGVILGCILALLALVNFIANSIKQRKKEIGIFKALGCSSKDIIKIFIIECILLILLSFVTSMILLPLVLKGFNYMVKYSVYIEINFMIDIKGILIILMLSIIMTIIIAMIAMLKVTKQKPVDTILDRN